MSMLLNFSFKESRKAYWQYLENIICYDESIETVQKQKKFWNYIRNTKKDSSGYCQYAFLLSFCSLRLVSLDVQGSLSFEWNFVVYVAL
jgi:hypothetical protein